MKLERWAHWAEIAASLAVVISLAILVQEVRRNTAAIERQAVLDRATAVNAPFMDDSPLPAIFAKIKAVDGTDAIDSAFVDRYDLTVEEATRWARHLSLIWQALEADFRARGTSPESERMIRALLAEEDNQLLWKMGAPQVGDAEFRTYVGHMIETTIAPEEPVVQEGH